MIHNQNSSSSLSEHLPIESLNFAMNALGIGKWEMNIQSRNVSCDARGKELFGFSIEHENNYSEFLSNVHPEDSERVAKAITTALNPSSDGNYDIKYKTLSAVDNTLRLIHSTGKAYFNAQKEPYRFSGIVIDISAELPLNTTAKEGDDVTELITAKKNLEESEAKFRSLILEAPVASCLFKGRDMVIDIANDTMLSYWAKGTSIIGKPFKVAVPEMIGQPFLQILDDVFTSGKTYTDFDAEVHLIANGELNIYYFDFTFKALRNANGEIYGVMDTAVDVTEKVIARRQLEESKAKLRDIIDQAPMAIGLLRSRDFIVETVNDAVLNAWGKDKSIIGLNLIDAVPELKGQIFIDLLEQVFDSGNPYYANATPAKIERNGVLEDIYFDFVYAPVKDSKGVTTGVMVLATTVTEHVKSKQKLEDSEARLRSIIANAPAGIGLFVGRDLIIENPNQVFIDIVGKGPNVEGMPLREAMPELITEGQPFLKILDDVFTTGVMFQSPGSMVKIMKNGVFTDNYYNITYSPVFDNKGKVYAILDIAIDVTAQVKAQKELEQAQTSLQNAIEVAELGTWTYDVKSHKMIYSQRMMDWYGFISPEINFDEAATALLADDKNRINNKLNDFLEHVVKGIDDEHEVINRLTGKKRIIHSIGITVFDEQGNAVKVEGTSSDVTVQREMQTALENLVRERTLELQVSNEELEATVDNLNKSNEELSQYAYVASHDLQEPLRKIQVFSNLLDQDQQINDQSKMLLKKIRQSSERMAMLIKDLLEFSRLLNSDKMFRPVELTRVLNDVIIDFELAVQEKNATIHVLSPLPTIDAVPLQMNQLLYNLLGNALKFINKDKHPVIEISAKKMVLDNDIKKFILRPNKNATYYDITIKDNGIGFDANYSERIFEVFKRLHARDVFPGSGIGLALCKKIVSNHEGYLYAESEVGKGATFHIILPDKSEKQN